MTQNLNAYLVIITWPNGTEGLLFPRPGNVPIADTEEKGKADFETAKQHLLEYGRVNAKAVKGAMIRLVHFEQYKPALDLFTLS